MSTAARILVVEDEAHLAQGLVFNLREESFTVQLAVDGETALEILAAETFDAIILDVMLPGRNGFSVAANCARNRILFPSSCLQHAAARRMYCTALARAPTTIFPSPLISPFCWRG